MHVLAGARLAWDTVKNLSSRAKLTYIVEVANWSVQWDGLSITQSLNKDHGFCARISTNPLALRSGIVHFGSFRTMFFRKWRYKLAPSQKKVLTVFHLPQEHGQYLILKQIQKDFDVIHTSCMATKHDLVRVGVIAEKIAVVPLGVDTSLFRPSISNKEEGRARLGIPPNTFVVGSFQKDGLGWDQGVKPKLEKGPDVFVQAISQVARRIPVHVLLVGPARGYVRRRLSELNVPFTDVGFVEDYRDLPLYYNLIDAYVIASRIEGGPKALLEAWASGVPVVSTNMGMVADIATHQYDALLSEPEDAASLSKAVQQIATSEYLSSSMVRAGMKTVKRFDWKIIAEQYMHDIYNRLLS